MMKAAFLGISAENFDRVYGAKQRAALAGRVELPDGVFSDVRAPELRNVEAIFSTWGMPAVSEAEIREYLPARSSASQTRRILELIDKAKAGDETDPAPVINDIAERIPSRGLVVVISDLFTSDQDALIKALHHFSYRNHEIVVMHVLADEELTFNFDGHVHFDNLEGPEDMMLDAKSIRAGYLEQVNAFLKKVGDGVRKMGADYVPMNTKIPFDKALVEYLARRRSGGR